MFTLVDEKSKDITISNERDYSNYKHVRWLFCAGLMKFSFVGKHATSEPGNWIYLNLLGLEVDFYHKSIL